MTGSIELGQLLRQPQVASRGLQPLHEIAAAGEQHAPAGVDQRDSRLSGLTADSLR